MTYSKLLVILFYFVALKRPGIFKISGFHNHNGIILKEYVYLIDKPHYKIILKITVR